MLYMFQAAMTHSLNRLRASKQYQHCRIQQKVPPDDTVE